MEEMSKKNAKKFKISWLAGTFSKSKKGANEKTEGNGKSPG